MLEERRPWAAADAVPAAAAAPAPSPGPAPGSRPGGASGAWRDPVLWLIAAAVLAALFTLSYTRLLRLQPSSWDLGIYTEYVKQLSRLHAPVVDVRGAGFNLLGDHFQVAVAVLAPFFRLVPSPATLLFGQALAAAVAVFPVADAARAFGGRAAGRLTGLAFGFSWGLQQLADYDFHEVALAVPLLAFSLSALVRRRPRAAIGWALPLVFVKEDQGFTVAAIGVLLGLSAAFSGPVTSGWRSRQPFFAAVPADDERRWGDGSTALWGGLFLLAWGLFWAVLAITVIIPHFNPQHEYYYWKDGGVVGGGQPFSAGGLLGQAVRGWSEKLQTVILVLLPTAFLALGSPVALVALPSLVLRFTSSNSAYWGTDWHYNATLMPIVFLAAAEAAGRLRGNPGPAGPAWPADGWRDWRRRGGTRPPGGGATRRPRGGLRALPAAVRTALARYGAGLMAVLTVPLLFQFPLSTLWHGSTYRLDAHVSAARAAMAVVPDGASVVTNLDLLAPLGARTDTFWIGNAGNPLTQYIVFDGIDSGYVPAVRQVPRFVAGLYPGDGYVQVFERDDVYVFRRG